MDFASIILFLMLYYVRPQEWIGWVTILKPITVVMAMAIVGMLMRYRGFRFRDFFRTSHDWLMLAYFAWIVLSSPTRFDTLKLVYTLFLFYVVTVQTLLRIQRIQTFLNWWTVMIFTVAVLALVSEFGFDPMGSSDLTHGMMRNRLVLNSSMFNNPNALGHGVYPVVLMLYFILVWKRPVFVKIFAIPVFIIPLWCLYQTQSKGSFLGCFVGLACGLVFGRPKPVQFLILVLAFTVGWAGMKALPRMEELDSSGHSQAIQGRVAAWHYGLNTLHENPMGIGYERFEQGFIRENHYSKASHSTYVQIGTELGYPGLFLYLALLYSCARTLLSAKTGDESQERVRRILFMLLVSYVVSGWMVNFTYRVTFFLMIGSIAAFHRHLLQKSAATTPVELAPQHESVLVQVLPQTPGAALPALTMTAMNPSLVLRPLGGSPMPGGSEETTESAQLGWTRFTWFDWLAVLGLMYATIRFWAFMMRHV